jgi:hypothetical protein
MSKSLWTAGLLALSLAGTVPTAQAAPRVDGLSRDHAGLVQIDRKRVCEKRGDHERCWWVGDRGWDDRRWQRWHHDHWREGYYWGPGFSLEIH